MKARICTSQKAGSTETQVLLMGQAQAAPHPVHLCNVLLMGWRQLLLLLLVGLQVLPTVYQPVRIWLAQAPCVCVYVDTYHSALMLLMGRLTSGRRLAGHAEHICKQAHSKWHDHIHIITSRLSAHTYSQHF
jgi:hypothetical protein